MLADARELLGDLVVATAEAAYDERWMHLAIATSAAVRAQPADASAVLDALDAPRVQRVCDDACERSTEWAHVAAARSALEAMRDLGCALDPSRGERAVIQRGRDIYRPLEPADGVAPWHWWWRAAAPPNERSLRVNERMRGLLPEPQPGTTLPALDLVAPRFRELVERGFADRDDNRVPLAHVLPPDPSRRPVDTASAALACARHLAYELQRRRRPPSRIVVAIGGNTNTLRFDPVAPVRLDLPFAMLVLDA